MLKFFAFFCTQNEIENEVVKTMKNFGNHSEGDHASLYETIIHALQARKKKKHIILAKILSIVDPNNG